MWKTIRKSGVFARCIEARYSAFSSLSYALSAGRDLHVARLVEDAS